MSETAIDLRSVWRRVRSSPGLPVLAIGGGTGVLILAVVITWVALAGRAEQSAAVIIILLNGMMKLSAARVTDLSFTT